MGRDAYIGLGATAHRSSFESRVTIKNMFFSLSTQLRIQKLCWWAVFLHQIINHEVEAIKKNLSIMRISSELPASIMPKLSHLLHLRCHQRTDDIEDRHNIVFISENNYPTHWRSHKIFPVSLNIIFPYLHSLGVHSA